MKFGQLEVISKPSKKPLQLKISRLYVWTVRKKKVSEIAYTISATVGDILVLKTVIISAEVYLHYCEADICNTMYQCY